MSTEHPDQEIYDKEIVDFHIFEKGIYRALTGRLHIPQKSKESFAKELHHKLYIKARADGLVCMRH